MIALSYYLQIWIGPGIDSMFLASSERMYRIAPWIMLFIAFWGIGRLFRRGGDAEPSETEDQSDRDEEYRYEEDEPYEDYDDEDDDYDAEE